MNNNTQIEQPKFAAFVKKTIKILIPLALGILILYLLYRDTPFDRMWAIIKDANYGILAFSVLFGLLGNIFRGYRWKILIMPLGYKPKTSNLIYAVLGNYAVNFAIPRGGEIWRCGVIAKDEKIPFTKLFGTMLIDRLLDTLTVFTIGLLAFGLNVDFFISYLKSNQEVLNQLVAYLSSWWLYFGLIFFIVLLLVVFKVFKNNIVIIKIKAFFRTIVMDMKMIGKMRRKKQLVMYTFLIWGSYFLYFYITFFAFGFTKDLGITAGLIAFAISSISMGIPTNGGMGAWHLAVTASLVLYGVALSSAEAFAFAVFATQSLWVILCGLFGMTALAVKNRHQ